MKEEIVPASDGYYVVFQHYDNYELYQGTRCGTKCEIWFEDHFHSHGWAILNPNDRVGYDPSLGRQIALLYALEGHSQEKIDLLFGAYYDHFGDQEYDHFQAFRHYVWKNE